jgi:hypothetical protein
MPKGGANAKMSKFPRIADYLQAKHTEVWEIINDAGMLGSLSPRKGSSVTFLLPDDATLKKYQKVLVSDKPEEVTDWIGTLILDKLIEKAGDFEGAVNLNHKKVPADKSGITGVKVAHDSGFKPFDRSGSAPRNNMAVWKITGEYKSAEGSAARRRRGKKGGLDEPVQPVISPVKVGTLTLFVNKVFDLEGEHLKEAVESQSARLSPCMIAVRNILNKWKAEGNNCLNCAYEIMSVDPILNFCLIFLNANVFSIDKLTDVNYQVAEGDMSYKDHIDDAIAHNAKNVAAHQQSCSHYGKCDEGDCPAYCPDLKVIFKAKPGLHRYIDEFKFVMAHYLRVINARGLDAVDMFNAMRNVVVSNRGLLSVPTKFNDSQEFKDSKYCCHMLCKDDAPLAAYTGGADKDDEEDADAEIEDKSNAATEEHALPADCVDALKKLQESSGGDSKFLAALHKILGSEADNSGDAPEEVKDEGKGK